MSSETILERRLAAVDRTVADIQRKLGVSPEGANWLERVEGSITDEAAFLEALEFGRAIRSADRPPVEDEDGS